MKSYSKIIIAILLVTGFCSGLPKDRKPAVRSSAPKIFGITDRAAGTHNVSNIGLFFENRGKLYPRRLSDGPSGEYPINSGRHYIWRINPKVGVAADPSQDLPVNVIQCHFTQNEEFEAVGGFHNPDNARVAFSDDPTTWPATGWPVQDADGNSLIYSDQDSYCVYDDAENSSTELGIQVIQRGYAYGISFARDLLFFRFDIINNGPYNLDSVYFGLYSDIDIGYVSGNSEWEDDLVGYDDDTTSVFLYDYDTYSAEWGGATGHFGIAYLKTPLINGVPGGLTDVHWNDYDDDYDDDGLMFAIMSSNRNYVSDNFEVDTYFHENNNDGNDHYDDVGTIPEGGDDIVAWGSSGPYYLAQGDTLTFHTAIVAGVDREAYMTNLAAAHAVVNDFHYNLAKPPPTPDLSVIPGNERNTLLWGDISEMALDGFTSEMDFEGYRLYRSIDKGVHWDNIDRNINPTIGPDPIPLEKFDIVNGIGDDSGLQYYYVDDDVLNGFEYWYSLTAFDRGSADIEQLESPIGNTLNAANTVAAIPRSSALGLVPAGVEEILYTGSTETNYTLNIADIHDANLTGSEYSLNFDYIVRNEIGDLKTTAALVIADSSLTKPHRYGIEFVDGGSRIQFLNYTTGETEPDRSYPYRTNYGYRLDGSNLKIIFNDPDTTAVPEEGDLITVSFAASATRGAADTVLAERPISFSQPQTTAGGIQFMLVPEYLADIVYSIENEISIELTAEEVASIHDTAYVLQFSASETDLDGYQFTVVNGYLDAIDSLVQVITSDTLYAGGTIQMGGILGVLDNTDEALPSQSMTVSFRTLEEKQPTLLSAYEFTVSGFFQQEQVIAAQFDRDTIRVVPNPYKVSSLWEPEFGELANEPIRQLQFINLPAACDIHIFTLAGDMIKKIRHNNGTGTATWDLRTDGGREIAPGIYLYVVKSGDKEYFNRFAVIK